MGQWVNRAHPSPHAAQLWAWYFWVVQAGTLGAYWFAFTLFAMRRPLWFGAGLLALVLGCIGIPVPLLPTTPFLLLAVFCFSRSSARMENWLLTHPRLGVGIRAWRDHGVISKRAKIVATIVVAISVAFPFVLYTPPWWARFSTLGIGLLVLVFLWSRPSQIPASDSKASVGQMPEVSS